jgi:hypothetical protein
VADCVGHVVALDVRAAVLDGLLGVDHELALAQELFRGHDE